MMAFPRSIVFTVGLLSASLASADRLPRPTAEYQADVLIRTERLGTVTVGTGHHWSTPNRDRRTMHFTGGSTSTMIVSRDKNLLWVLYPNNNFFAFPGRPYTGGFQVYPPETWYGFDITMKEVAKEPVDGVATTKYEVTIPRAEDDTYTGHLWLTPENILVRVRVGDQTDKIELDLSKLHVAPQDPELLDLPKGATPLKNPVYMGR